MTRAPVFYAENGKITHRGRPITQKQSDDYADLYRKEALLAVKADDWQAEEWARGFLRELTTAHFDAARAGGMAR